MNAETMRLLLPPEQYRAAELGIHKDEYAVGYLHIRPWGVELDAHADIPMDESAMNHAMPNNHPVKQQD